MDRNTRPQISRGLLQRMTNSGANFGGNSSNSLFGASSQSFGQRKHVDNNRRMVRKYSNSHLVAASPSRDAVRQVGAEITPQKKHQKPAAGQPKTGQNRPSVGFKEPPGRMGGV